MTATDSRDTPSPLARALAEQAAAQLDDLRRARGLDGSTFSALAARAREIRDRLDAWDVGPATTESIAQHGSVLRAVAALLDNPRADAIPPSNDAIYNAVLDITELNPIVETLGGTRAGRDAIRAHLDADDPRTARAGRLALSFASVCHRGGLRVTPPSVAGGPVGIDLDRWRLLASAAVPLHESEIGDAACEAERTLRNAKRAGLLLLEAGAAMDYPPLTVADDATALGVMHERLDAFMLRARAIVLDRVGSDQAFGLVVHATLPARNAASGRMLFAECLRAVNLCESDDPRVDGFRTILGAMERAG